MTVDYKGRKVEITEYSGSYDEPFVDAANYIDGEMEDCSNEEMDEILDLHAGKISQELLEHAMCRAYDRAKAARYGD